MRKTNNYIALLLVCLFAFGSLSAQAPKNRTVTTIVADVLTQLPAEKPNQYNQLMNELTGTGEEGLMSLINSVNNPGPKSNEKVEFALSGWTNYVAKDQAKRLETANTYAKALGLKLHEETKAFIIRQLEMIGGEDNIDALASFLTDTRLVGPASQALVALRTAKANQAIVAALKSEQPEEMRIQLVNAIAQSNTTNVEALLLELLKDAKSLNYKKTVQKALSRLGSSSSLKPLKKAASNEKFAYGKDGSTASYLALLNTLKSSNTKAVGKEAHALLKTGKKQNKPDLQIAAMELLMSMQSENKSKLMIYSLKDGNPALVASTLRMFSNKLDNKEYNTLIKLLNASSPATQTPIIYWLGNQKMEKAVSEISKFTRSDNPLLKTAAIRSLAKIGNKDALIKLVELLKSDNSETIALAKDALTTYNGDMSYELTSKFNDSSDEGKVTILQLIASRRMESQYNMVYNQLFIDNPTVKAEAANTLQYVSTEENLKDLFLQLEKSDAELVPALQQAINAALSDLSTDEQMIVIAEQANKKGIKRHLYYPAMAYTGTQDAMEQLVGEYSNATNDDQKRAAFEALANWKSFDVIYPLLDIARNSDNNTEKSEAIDAIINTIVKSSQTQAVKYLFLREALEMANNDKQKNSIIVELGNTKMYQALLLLEPYMDIASLKENAALASMKLALDNPSFVSAKVTFILNKVSDTLDNPDAGYQRQAIKKFIDENSLGDGYISLFNGKDLTGWKGLVGNPISRDKMSKKELATAQEKVDKEALKNWIVQDGTIFFTGKGDNLCTEKSYGDFEMLVDWKLYPGAEPDAGIYLRGTPQVQIWDISRTNVGAQVGSGGLYNNQTHKSIPLKVADLELGEWNTFYIKMIGDRVTVHLNGEIVVDNVILENYWDRNQSIFPVEQIELQAHGSEVAYRDIYIKEIEHTKPFTLSEEEKKENFELLFDGTNMHHWTGNTQDYIIENGNMVIYPSNSHGGNLFTKKEYDNFVFRFEFQLTEGANNGLGIRTPMEGDAAYLGMELQILDNDAAVYKNLDEYQYHGSVYGVIPAKRGYLKPLGEWNYQEVVADGDNIKVTLNGTTIVDGNIREASKNGAIDGKDHPGLLNKSGHIGFLGHGSVVKFKNIRVKEL
jgi:HEAT repeat protein